MLLILILALQAESQTHNHFDVGKLVRITETSDLNALAILVKKHDHIVFDSSRLEDGSLFYYTREMKVNGNILACSIDVKGKMVALTFSTIDIGTYIDFRNQILGLGFISSGKTKASFTGMLEMEDFTKGKFEIGNGTRQKENGAVEYEFIFVMW
ncbi:MAG: hypothetical protein H0V30_14020 [Chitinophagaceae bacterium]|nr:hypothetical protein [Chitinophagaceae bacterium]